MVMNGSDVGGDDGYLYWVEGIRLLGIDLGGCRADGGGGGSSSSVCSS